METVVESQFELEPKDQIKKELYEEEKVPLDNLNNHKKSHNYKSTPYISQINAKKLKEVKFS